MVANLPRIDVRVKWDAFAGVYSADTATIPNFPEAHGMQRRDIQRNLVERARAMGLSHVELRVHYPNGTLRPLFVH